MSRPGLEQTSVCRTLIDQKARVRKADAICPGKCQSGMRLLDEIIEIAFPAAVEIAEERQPAAIAEDGPMGEMDRTHAGEIAICLRNAQDISKPPEAGPHDHRAQQSRFDDDDAAHVVLGNLILERNDGPQFGRIVMWFFLDRIALFEP